MPYAPSYIPSAKKQTLRGVYFRVGMEDCIDSPILNNEVGDAEEHYKFYFLTESTASWLASTASPFPWTNP